ncbi:MAG: MaoC/PaaZ C-terminal domain-containing protein [Myxococcota bacterium]
MSLSRVLGRAAVAAVRKKQGEVPGGASAVPRLEAAARRVRLEPEAVARYERACALPEGQGPVPPAYPETLFLGPMAELATARGFPLSPLGLIHVRQTLSPQAPIPRAATLDLACRIADARDLERGIEIDMAMEARMDGAVAWTGVATMLSRNARTRARGGGARPEREVPEPGADDVVFEAGPRTGLAYAAASGDYNPHHLYPWTARLLGYRRPIAHGMWTLARALGLLGGVRPLAPPFHVDASFKRPLFLPGRSRFHWEPAEARALRFEVREADGGAPQLLGTVRP